MESSIGMFASMQKHLLLQHDEKDILNRFGARYRENGKFRYGKNWKSRQTVKCHTAQKGEVYPYGLCQNTLHKIKLKSYHPIFIETWRDTHKMI